MRLALDLNLPADSRLLGATRTMLAAYLMEMGTPPAIVDDVVLAMDEACSNVLQHAYPDGGGDATFVVRAGLAPDEILIEVVDEGVGFDMMAEPRGPDRAGMLASRGRGLDLMRRLMTTVEVESPTPTGGTRLRLVRLLPPRDGPLPSE
jgi:serine/threonine-protein kinase RsbW